MICQKGMHFCKKSLDVLDYYPLVDGEGNISEFAEVEALDDPLNSDDGKYCSKKLKIGAKLSFFDLVKASFSFDFEKIEIGTPTESDGKNNAQIGSSGDWAQIGSSGKNAVICCSGDGSCAKGKIGSWITLAEWARDKYTGEKIPVCVKTERIDGERIKEDTFYKMINGYFVEVEE